MQLTVKGKHLDVGDSLREHVQTSLSHAASKYLRDSSGAEATVVFTKEKNHRYRAHVSILIRSVLLEAQHETDDPYTAFDGAAAKAATRLGRYKDKIRDHHRKEDPVEMHEAAYTTFQGSEDEAEGGDEPAVVAEMQTNIQTLAVSDAVMRLELGDLPALLFKNPATGGFNMVYRRKDGNIGWVDPGAGKKSDAADSHDHVEAKKTGTKK